MLANTLKSSDHIEILDWRKNHINIWINSCFCKVKLIDSYYYLTKILIKSVQTEVVCFSQKILRYDFTENIFPHLIEEQKSLNLFYS